MMLYKLELGHNPADKNQIRLLCEKWGGNWTQYSNQMDQEILLGLQEPWRFDNVK